MAKAEAYSETHKRNISLDEAHQLYASQLGKKQRFVFRCGDSNCRSKLNPLVVGALYDRKDIAGEKHYSPYFREHYLYSHIPNCTWIEALEKSSNNSNPQNNNSAGWAVSTNGLIFDLDPHAQSSSSGNIHTTGTHNVNNIDRPETSRFMSVIAMRYVHYTKYQREKIRLDIGRQCSGTFYSICRPLHTFHPHYQSRHIYYGLVTVIELDNVFLIQFFKKMASDGSKANKNSIAQFSLLKSRLAKEDLSLMQLLKDLVKESESAICFFYSNDLPSTKNINGNHLTRFDVRNLSHISLIPISKITADTSEL